MKIPDELIQEEVEKQYYKKIEDELSKLYNRSIEKQSQFYQHVLLVSASILGITITLHSFNSLCPAIRLVLVAAVIFLSLGTLLTGIVGFSYKEIYERTRINCVKELLEAKKEHRIMNQKVFTKVKKSTLILGKLSLIFLGFSILLLTLYFVLALYSN